MQTPIQTPPTQSPSTTQKYTSISQLALYSPPNPQIPLLQIFTKSALSPHPHPHPHTSPRLTFYYDASKYTKNLKKQIMYYIVRMLNEEIPKLKQGMFSVVFVNGGLGDFVYFRRVVGMMPAEFLGKLREFFVVGAGVGVRVVGFFMCGEVNRYIDAKTRYVTSLQDIQPTKNTNPTNPQTHPNSSLSLTTNLLTSPTTLTHPTTPITTTHSPITPTTTTTSPLQTKLICNKLYGKELSQYELSPHGIPLIIETLLLHLCSKKEFLQVEGIMRKSCDVEELERLEVGIMERMGDKQGKEGKEGMMGMEKGGDWREVIWKEQDPYVVCGCVKKILNNLNTPLFPYQTYQQIITNPPTQSQTTLYIQSLLKTMPSLNLHVLLFLLTFLKNGIIKNQAYNKMSSYNLAVVFGPCFFRPKHYKLEDLMASGRFSYLVKVLLEDGEEIFGGLWGEVGAWFGDGLEMG